MGSTSIHRRVTLTLQIILLVELILSLYGQQWLAALTTTMVLLITLAPFFLKRFLNVYIPPEFMVLAIIFVFASLFLGEVQGYYTRFWWWDIALHTSSGFLLGMIGFALVYVLNESEDIGLYMKPGFIAFFAFLFALGIGVLWEVFEFSMDQFFHTNMQKPMLNDPSGLTDTMWDLIVDGIGALIISVMGYGYIKTTKNESFLERWIHRFIERNPHLFKHRD